MRVIGKGTPILGAQIKEDGVQFGIYTDHEIGMVLKIYRGKEKACLGICYLTKEEYSTGDIYHIALEEVKEGDYYTWHTLGEAGEIGNVLMDPYTRAVEEIEKGSNTYYSVVIPNNVYLGAKPKTDWKDTVIYEAHIGAFTKADMNIETYKRGTFEGFLTHIDELKEMGVTAIELLPIYKWNKKTLAHTSPVTGEQMEDVWGYNSIGFFALQEDYGVGETPGERIDQFRTFVDQVHRKGLEIILDVVYNHTGEGGEGGTVFHFKELGNNTYYKMDGQKYKNCTGTGNVFNTTHPITKQLVIDSLRYWVVEMGIDGFRFDLASTLGQDENGKWMQNSLLDDIAKDPILSHVKLISESWDAKGSYNVGQMPHPFVEWNDRFRDTIRRFVKGDLGMTKELAQCIEGESIYFADDRKGPFSNIHFVTAHDGFTLWDLVSYNEKHNDANGEENRDGNNQNYSDNCGYEGESNSEQIIYLRHKRMRNYLTLLFISYGVPMMLMGDEIGRTQKGNNNAYCQDNELLWMDWNEDHFKIDLRDFIKQLTSFRKSTHYVKNRLSTTIKWHGTECNKPDWSYHSCSLACEIICNEEHLYIIMNSYLEQLTFDLPKVENGWIKLVDTAKELVEEAYGRFYESKYCIEPYSIVILKA